MQFSKQAVPKRFNPASGDDADLTAHDLFGEVLIIERAVAKLAASVPPHCPKAAIRLEKRLCTVPAET